MSGFAVDVAVGTDTAQPLFSHRKITGSFRTPHMLALSLKVPPFEVPAPKKQSTTLSCFLILIESPAPVAMGKHPPSVPLSPNTPRVGSTTCITPPRPLLVPPSLPARPHRLPSSGIPRAPQ